MVIANVLPFQHQTRILRGAHDGRFRLDFGTWGELSFLVVFPFPVVFPFLVVSPVSGTKIELAVVAKETSLLQRFPCEAAAVT